MNQTKNDFMSELEKLQSRDYVFGLTEQLGKEYDEMINGMHGDDIVNTGMLLLSYYYDLMEKDFDLGMNATKVIFKGYEDIRYTDLFAPYFDSIKTRRLWVDLGMNSKSGGIRESVIILNLYFRWYTSTFELFRKMLVFDCYCLGLKTGNQINVKNFLFKSSNPAKMLRSEGTQDIITHLDCYNPSLRHSIAHGNILILPSLGIVIRETDEKKQGVIQRIYKDTDEFIEDVKPNIDIMYGSIRFFFYIINGLLMHKFKETFKDYWGDWFTDPVLIDMVKNINVDY